MMRLEGSLKLPHIEWEYKKIQVNRLCTMLKKKLFFTYMNPDQYRDIIN